MQESMASTSLAYGRDRLNVELPFEATTLEARVSETAPLDAPAIAAAFERAGLLEALRSARSIAIVANDQTRKGGMRTTLAAVGLLLERAAVARERVALVIAYGLHARQSDAISAEIYGEDFLARVRLVHHDGRDLATLRRVGELEGGHPLHLAAAVVDAELRVLVGAIGFHYHAGFSGGRKAVMPGVADEATIVRNHLRVLDRNGPNGRAAGCAPARLDGNPVSEEMFASLRLLEATGGRTFLANAILGATRGGGGTAIVDVACGFDHEPAFRAGAARLFAANTVALDASRPFGGVIASAGGWPYDASLYQAHKAYDNAFRAVAPAVSRGERPIVVLLARCDEGLGHPRFAHWLQHPTRAAHYEAVLAGYEIVGQTSLAVRDKAAFTRTLAVTDLDEATCAKIGWERVPSLSEAIERAHREGGERRWALMPAAAAVLPVE
jgi:nickel-dependent lactate racemase